MGERGVRAASARSIEIDFYWNGERCRERLKLAPTPANRRYAERLKAEILNRIELGTFDYEAYFPGKRRRGRGFAAYAERWIAGRRAELKASTAHGYEEILHGILIPALGERPLRSITRAWARDLIREKAYGAKRAGNVVSVLRMILAEAEEDGLVRENVLAGWRPRVKRVPKADPIDPFDAAERAAIIDACDGEARNMLEFGFWTGLRTSELVALLWTDIDWVRGAARISRARTQHASEPEATKTTTGERDVKLLAPALAALKRQKAYTALRGAEIFRNPRTGDPWTGDQALRKTLWQHVLRKAGVRYRYPYQMRHTFASMMLMAGEPVMWVSAQLGHADWAFTARTYSRWIPSDMPEAGSRAEDRFGQDLVNIARKPRDGAA